MNKQKRIHELDILRGLAVIGMIIFHYYFMMDYFGVGIYDVYHCPLLILARFVQFSFLGLVGVSLAISTKNIKQQWLRAFKVIMFAFVVTLATAIFAPQVYVKFGILHHLAVAIFLLSPISKKKYTSLILGVFAIAFGFFLRTKASASWILILLGVTPINFAALDHFSIFPWIGVILIGIFIGNAFYKDKTGFIKKSIAPLELIGRHTLVIYMIHVPIIYGIIEFILK